MTYDLWIIFHSHRIVGVKVYYLAVRCKAKQKIELGRWLAPHVLVHNWFVNFQNHILFFVFIRELSQRSLPIFIDSYQSIIDSFVWEAIWFCMNACTLSNCKGKIFRSERLRKQKLRRKQQHNHFLFLLRHTFYTYMYTYMNVYTMCDVYRENNK